MGLEIPVNALAALGLSNRASKQEILSKVINLMRQKPQQMQELAEYQRLLLDPSTRFLVEFFYFYDDEVAEN